MNRKLKEKLWGCFPHLILALVAIVCFLPLLLIVSASFMSDAEITMNGYAFIPKDFTPEAYLYILKKPAQLLSSYAVTIIVTLFGTVIGLLLTAMLAYGISRKDYPFAKATTLFVYMTLVRKDVVSINDASGESKTHKYAAFTTGVGPGSVQVESANAGFPVVQAQTLPAYVSTGTIQAALTAISINSEHPERAMMVLDYLFEDKDTYNMLCYGIEGKHYNKVNDYSIELIEGSGYNPGIAWEFGSWFNAKLLSGQDEDHWDQMKEINETAITSQILGFVYDSSAVKNEMAQITALISEYLPGLLTGSVDPEEKIPELIEKMDSAGMEKVIEDANAQLAEWNEAK